MGGTYEASGVSVDRGDRLVSRIAGIRSTAIGPIGGFAGGMPLDLDRYPEPVIMSATDGVGTKLLVARRLGVWDTIGIDLVAMCVNDLAVCGADPVQFLDYIACGRIDEQLLQTIITGIARGCEIAGCTLVGGETAEMPGVYGEDDLDLAGFAVGVVNRPDVLPRLETIAEGDVILGLPSSGIHSNGLSLARTALADADDDLWRELITPTRIYCRELALARPHIKAAAHITGGGLAANTARVVPAAMRPVFSWDWAVPEVFDTIARLGDVASEEMRRVFNMGIGIALIAAPEAEPQIRRELGAELVRIGEVVRG
jgi:phosphoribosylformylglycinamidine cyclo-ligase